MLRNITFILFLFIGLGLQAQSQEEQIRKDFIDYQNLIKKGEYEASLDYVYPKFFTLVSKEKMLKMMKTMINNKMVSMEFGDTKVLEVGDKQTIDSTEYIVFSYITEITMKVIVAGGKGNLEQQQLLNQRMQTAFEKQYGKENVKFNKKTGYFTITPTKKAVAVSEDHGKTWTYMAVEAQQKAMIETILPDAVVKELF